MTDDTEGTSETSEEPGLGLLGGGPTTSDGSDSDYKVLARKYRPSSFSDDFIGHEAMVQTLANAFETSRIAHAFILTGVRGIGKTTTARILARALNYVGPDGDTGPSIQMSEEGEHCRAIIEGRHMDVIEMDAASRTGIGDIREIIESVRFLPVQARYKVYIIDEVHMLSNQAFNGLLKTLEEPPPHVKFIFATTEIRKVPVTVLSRCQRFDLKRFTADQLVGYLTNICKLENAEVEKGGLGLIARAAEGSARDALSLLDQAIALGAGDKVSETQVRDMLGLADRARVIDLFDMIMSGKVADAIDELREQYDAGADPAVIIGDLLEFTHWLTRLKVADAAAKDTTATESDLKRGVDMAERLTLRVLTRTWQMLLKGLEDVRRAPQPISAAEMVIIRLAYVSDLPAPEELVRQLSENPPAATGKATSRAQSTGHRAQVEPARATAEPTIPNQSSGNSRPQAQATEARRETEPLAEAPALPEAFTRVTSFDDVLALVAKNRDIHLQTQLEDHVHLVSFAPGRIDLRLRSEADSQLIRQLSTKLEKWTGVRWFVGASEEEGAPTVRSVVLSREAERREQAKADPLVAEVLKTFPGAEILSIRDRVVEPSTEVTDETDDD